MENMKTAVASLRREATTVSSMTLLYEKIETLLREHSAELGDFNGSYRFVLIDRGVSYAGRLDGGVYTRLNENASVDVTVSATDANFLALLSGRLSVVKATLFGKIKVKGDMNVLMGFARFLA